MEKILEVLLIQVLPSLTDLLQGILLSPYHQFRSLYIQESRQGIQVHLLQ